MDEQPKISDPSYQDKDIRLKPIVLSIAIILVVTLVSMVLMKLLFDSYARRAARSRDVPLTTATARNLEDSPLLQVDEAIDLETYRAWEDGLVTSYGWNTSTNGTVTMRIPVERARALMLERGFPVRAGADAAGP